MNPTSVLLDQAELAERNDGLLGDIAAAEAELRKRGLQVPTRPTVPTFTDVGISGKAIPGVDIVHYNELLQAHSLSLRAKASDHSGVRLMPLPGDPNKPPIQTMSNKPPSNAPTPGMLPLSTRYKELAKSDPVQASYFFRDNKAGLIAEATALAAGVRQEEARLLAEKAKGGALCQQFRELQASDPGEATRFYRENKARLLRGE